MRRGYNQYARPSLSYYQPIQKGKPFWKSEEGREPRGIGREKSVNPEAYQNPYLLQHNPFSHFPPAAPPQLPSGGGGGGGGGGGTTAPHKPNFGWQPLPQKASLEPLFQREMAPGLAGGKGKRIKNKLGACVTGGLVTRSRIGCSSSRLSSCSRLSRRRSHRGRFGEVIGGWTGLMGEFWVS